MVYFQIFLLSILSILLFLYLIIKSSSEEIIINEVNIFLNINLFKYFKLMEICFFPQNLKKIIAAAKIDFRHLNLKLP